ncbi:MAG: signal peptidase I [Endomicrobium sp.]|jgi:signal peptidase I|nr:signal peptidase I [Endomicrobium sp.]
MLLRYSSIEFKLFFIGCVFFVIDVIITLIVKKYFKIALSRKYFNKIYSLINTLWHAFIATSIIMFFFVQAFKIPSGSMRNTLIEGDYIFVNKFAYGFHIPFFNNFKRFVIFNGSDVRRGDLIVFKSPYEPEKHYIKRCVAIAGDNVSIKNKNLFINGVPVDSSYAIFNDTDIFKKINLFDNNIEKYQKYWEQGRFVSISSVRDNFGPVVVPNNHYMMLGDNRDFSFDSRFWGPLNDKYIKGKVFLLYWPIKRWRLL